MLNKNVISWIAAVGLGALGTWQYHLAQLSSRFDTFFGDRGDVRGFVYFCEHWYQVLQGKTDLLSPGIFYPVKGTLAYSDLLFGFALPYSIFRAAGFGMFTSVELAVILITFLTYLACFVLLRFMLRFSLLASCLGAMFFAFSSPKFFQIIHLQLQFVLFLPLIFICVTYFVKHADTLDQKRAALWLSLAGLFFNLQILTAFYYAWFFVFWGALFLLLAVIFRASRHFIFSLVRKYWPAMLVAALVLLIGFIPFLVVYIPTIRVGTWYTYSNVALMIPEWWSLLSMGDGNYVWGWLANVVRPEPWPDAWGELMIGIGLIPSLTWLALTVYAVVLIKRHHSQTNATAPAIAPDIGRIFLAVTVLATTLFYLLGLKYGGHSPWYYIYQVFPGAGAIRAMSRYVIFLTLPMAIGFAFILDLGFKKVIKRKGLFARRAFAAVIAIVACFGVFEQFGWFKTGSTGFSVPREEAYLNAMAGKLSNDCAAFYVVPGKGRHNTFEYQYDAMLISILSGIPTLNASSSQFPQQWFLYNVKDPNYETNVQKWISLHGITGKVCRLEINPQVGAFGPAEPNPIDDAQFFVIQHFRDLKKHEPRTAEVDPYAAKVNDCGKNTRACRAAVALELFYFTGFAEAGSYILRLYEVGLARLPRFEEFEAEMERLRQYIYSDGWESAKTRFASEFVRSTEFTKRHEGTSDEKYAAELWRATGVNPAPSKLATANAEFRGHADLLRVIAEHKSVVNQLSDRGFVTLLYFGYLQREPEMPGLERWLETLRDTDRTHVISGFVDSVEYRERFGE